MSIKNVNKYKASKDLRKEVYLYVEKLLGRELNEKEVSSLSHKVRDAITFQNQTLNEQFKKACKAQNRSKIEINRLKRKIKKYENIRPS